MIRILHSVSNMDRAGIETMLMNYYRYMDKSKVQFDFLCNKKKPGAYDDEIKSMGGRIYHTPGLNPAKYPVYLKYMRELFQEHAKKNDLKIIGAGDYKTFYDEGFIDLTPYEWVDLFRNAEKVITGTFHGTVFSIKYNKSVLCYPTEKNRINKIRSLLSDMKIASRLLEVGCEDDFIPLLDTPMDYTETRNYIAQKIQEADDFLTGDKS